MTAGADTQGEVDGHIVVDKVYSSADPAITYRSLTAREREAFAAATEVAEVTTTATGDGIGKNAGKTVSSLDEAAAANGCWYFTFTGKATATLGNVLYTFWQNTAVCASRGRVTNVWVDNVGGETSTPGWRYERDQNRSWTKNMGWEGRGVAQYVFILGAGGVDIGFPTTCLQGRVNANRHDKLALRSCNIG